MEYQLTDLELQAWAILEWMKVRSWPNQPSRDIPSMATLIRLGLVTEDYCEDENSPNYLAWTMMITDKGKEEFKRLSVLIRIYTYIRASCDFEASELIKTELSIDQLPEFLVHKNEKIREAAITALEAHGFAGNKSTVVDHSI